MVNYRIIGADNCAVYGISAYENERHLKSIDGIADDKSLVQKLVDICNELEIELCHFDDIVEDFLTDFCVSY